MASLPDPIKTLSGDGRKIYEDIAARRAAKGVHHLGPYVPLLNHPQLAKRIEQLGYYYKYEATLPRDVYQFIVLVFSKHSDIAFEWADHIAAARAAGLSDEIIADIAEEKTVFPEPYGSVRACMSCALDYKSIPQPLQDEIIKAFGIPGLLEIVTLCGFYGLIGMVNVCFDVPLPAHAEPAAKD
jgi:4-carboxymuconolactone decarboxylase